jgi:hypothetical protein
MIWVARVHDSEYGVKLIEYNYWAMNLRQTESYQAC